MRMGRFKLAALIGGVTAFALHWVLHFAVAGALFAAVGLSGAGQSPAEAGPNCGDVQRIEAKALTDHGCDSGEWHFVINQVDTQANAPGQIEVTFANGQTLYVPLEKFTGKVAHYTTYGNLSSSVTQAVAYIYPGWGGQFNLSHGPCVFTTPTPTPTPTVTPTPTPTVTPTPLPNPTPAPVGTSIDRAPVGFPDTGGAPVCEDEGLSTGAIVLIILASGGLFVAGMIVGAGITRERARSR